MSAGPSKLSDRLFKTLRRLLTESAALRTKNAVRFALDILESNGVSEIEVRDRLGFDVRLMTGDKVVTASVIRKGHFTFEVMEALAGALGASALDPAGLLFVDVGANVGTSCLNAHGIGFRRIVAVEPDPDNFRLLERNVAQLEDAEVRLVNAAAGERRATATLHRHRFNFGAHSLLRLPLSQAGSGHEVVVLPLTALVTDGEPFVLLLDVEGLEPDVIRGGRDLLLAHCRGLCVELAPSRYSDEDARYLAEFAQAFAPSFLHVPSGEWRPTGEFLRVMEAQRKAYFDVILVSQ